MSITYILMFLILGTAITATVYFIQINEKLMRFKNQTDKFVSDINSAFEELKQQCPYEINSDIPLEKKISVSEKINQNIRNVISSSPEVYKNSDFRKIYNLTEKIKMSNKFYHTSNDVYNEMCRKFPAMLINKFIKTAK